jgi:hypothetical protein
MEARLLDWLLGSWIAHWPIVRKLDERHRLFDLDRCAEGHTAKAPLLFSEDLELSHPWLGQVCVNSDFLHQKSGRADVR